MKVRDIVEGIKFEPLRIPMKAPVRDAVHAMNERNVGAALITDEGGRIVGILSERDVLRHIEKGSFDAAVESVGTPRERMVFGRLDDEVEDAMAILDKHHIRHLPVLDKDGSLASLLSIRDLMRAVLDEARNDRSALMGYIVGSYPNT